MNYELLILNYFRFLPWAVLTRFAYNHSDPCGHGYTDWNWVLRVGDCYKPNDKQDNITSKTVIVHFTLTQFFRSFRSFRG